MKVFVRQQEGAFRRGDESIFRLGRPNQQSYPKSRFCSAAVSLLLRFAQHQQEMNEADAVVAQIARPTAQKIGKALLQYFDLTREGTDETSQVKIRKGQSYFRRMVLANYNNECCITGLNVPQLLRASHIVAWADDPKNRMNPENGLCLSATYDAAFDQHLISFDDDYRMIVSQHIKDYYTADITKEYFQKREGQKLTIPTQFLPDKKLMEKHREKMVG
ncbi:MAG: HNH endonuclease [Bacteroidales bacterium]|nr:HNH endonuclease [Bacteroidales bacterium]